MVLFVFLEVGPSILFLAFPLFLDALVYLWLAGFRHLQSIPVLGDSWLLWKPFGFVAIKQIRAVPISGPALQKNKNKKQNPHSGSGFDSKNQTQFWFGSWSPGPKPVVNFWLVLSSCLFKKKKLLQSPGSGSSKMRIPVSVPFSSSALKKQKPQFRFKTGFKAQFWFNFY